MYLSEGPHHERDLTDDDSQRLPEGDTIGIVARRSKEVEGRIDVEVTVNDVEDYVYVNSLDAVFRLLMKLIETLLPKDEAHPALVIELIKQLQPAWEKTQRTVILQLAGMALTREEGQGS